MTDDDLREYVVRVHERTRIVVAAIPADRVDWRSAPGEWTLGEVAMHLANARVWNAAAVAGIAEGYRGHAADGLDLAALIAAQDDSAARSRSLLLTANLGGDSRNARGDVTSAWMRLLGGLIEHEVHHRAQLCALLAQAGADAPPLFGLFEEDLW